MNKKMSWKKSPPELIARFDEALPRDPRVERRQMFGYPCAFTNGNMFTGLHQDKLFVRLAEKERGELLRRAGARPFEPMPGRPMAEYVVVPDSLPRQQLAKWIAAALEYASALPAKKK